MTMVELIARDPVKFAPNIRMGRWGVWFFDERWRLPYRWHEWRRGNGWVSLMILGAAVSVCRLENV
jgi:hypothetical protein